VLTWYRTADEVLVYDTKPSNFVKSAAGQLDPIDLIMSIYPPNLFAAIKLPQAPPPPSPV
jgi:hypothetical protein